MALPESLRLTLILALCVEPAFAQTASYTDDNPSVSPDGKKIAFMSDRDGDIEIYVMNADGSTAKLLTEECEKLGHPVWSTDDSQIFYTATRGGATRIWEISTDGGGARPVK
jgi:TolB protein